MFTFSVKHPEHENQDRAWISSDLCLAVIADGLGGHDNSEKASEEIINVAKQAENFIKREKENWPSNTLHYARKQVQTLQIKYPGIAASSACVWRDKDKVFYAWCGDCRIWVWSDGELKPLTRDHNIIYNMLKEGSITQFKADFLYDVFQKARSKSEAYKLGGSLAKKLFQKRHLVCSEIGKGEISKGSYNMSNNDVVILTTDGIHDVLTISEMENILSECEIQDYSRSLVEAARFKQNEKQHLLDDTTCVIIPPKKSLLNKVKVFLRI